MLFPRGAQDLQSDNMLAPPPWCRALLWVPSDFSRMEREQRILKGAMKEDAHDNSPKAQWSLAPFYSKLREGKDLVKVTKQVNLGGDFKVNVPSSPRRSHLWFHPWAGTWMGFSKLPEICCSLSFYPDLQIPGPQPLWGSVWQSPLLLSAVPVSLVPLLEEKSPSGSSALNTCSLFSLVLGDHRVRDTWIRAA